MDKNEPGGNGLNSKQTATAGNRENVILLKISGMSCQNCLRRVKETINSVPGVVSAEVELTTGQAVVKVSPKSPPDIKALVNAIKKAGYDAREIRGEKDSKDKEHHHIGWWQLNIIIGLGAFIPLFICEWIFHLGGEKWFHYVSFALAVPVQIICGKQFYIGAWRQLKRGSSNMDTLVALGSSAAFGYSVWALFAGQSHLYFTEAIGIITLISFGHFLEARMSQRAGAALKALMNLAPPMARRIDENQREIEVPVSELNPGDTVLIKPGDHCPTDGVVIKGYASFNESMLTGESMPVEKYPGAVVYAGTVNQDGLVVVRVEAVGEETALARIIETVRRAQESKADIQRLADKVSNVFVPVVIVIAIITALSWGFNYDGMLKMHQSLSWLLWHTETPPSAVAAAFIHLAAVLIIACPCAMGLATPVAIMAGTSVAARRGILIRDGRALEKSGKITCIVFDKTGTLTEGRIEVSKAIDPHTGSEIEKEVWKIAQNISCVSNHPVSKAVCIAAKAMGDGNVNEKPVSFNYENGWRELRGSGVEMRIELADKKTEIYRLGSIKWLSSCGVDVAAGLIENIERGQMTVGLSKDSKLLALFELEDRIKDGARDVVEELQKKGLKVFIITGDRYETAVRVAERCGLNEKDVFAEITPDKKAAIIQSLQQQGERVAFAGDGINDAPALETADLGIAVGKATDIAREAAEIVLLKSDIHAIPEAISLAQATLKTIKQNLFWAFFYNAVAVPLAALGFLSPILCAAAMGISDVVVIGNALRLARWRYDKYML
ncbi:MAG: heavy metal translocating P-type ATPase [Verrucomicrobiia bacterium]